MIQNNKYSIQHREQTMIGLFDADLLDGGTRHPNLVLLKLAGFFKDNDIQFELIKDTYADVKKYTYVYISKVFTFTKDPIFYIKAKNEGRENNFVIGGTGNYATQINIKKFLKERNSDMTKLENDVFLNQYPNKRGGLKKIWNRHGTPNALLSSL